MITIKYSECSSRSLPKFNRLYLIHYVPVLQISQKFIRNSELSSRQTNRQRAVKMIPRKSSWDMNSVTFQWAIFLWLFGFLIKRTNKVSISPPICAEGARVTCSGENVVLTSRRRRELGVTKASIRSFAVIPAAEWLRSGCTRLSEF